MRDSLFCFGGENVLLHGDFIVLAEPSIPGHARHDNVPIGIAHRIWHLMFMAATAVSNVSGAPKLQGAFRSAAARCHGRRDGRCLFFQVRRAADDGKRCDGPSEMFHKEKGLQFFHREDVREDSRTFFVF